MCDGDIRDYEIMIYTMIDERHYTVSSHYHTLTLLIQSSSPPLQLAPSSNVNIFERHGKFIAKSTVYTNN